MLTHRTVLVSCHIKNSPQAIPLATSILKSYQPFKQEVNILLEDFDLSDSPAYAAEKILSHKPDSVGLSVYIWNREFFLKTAELIKAKSRTIPVFAGGADITASAESLIPDNNFDYLIKGEGEIPFSRLMEFLTGKNNNKPDKILPASYLTNLEEIPSPYLNRIIDPQKWDGLLWELSRGCPFNCSFCSESRGVKGVRYYSEERIKNELILFEEQKVEQIFVLDPTFNVDKKRALKILSLIKQYSPDIHFTFEIRAELLDHELAKSFSQLNCSLQIGLQSSGIDVLKNVNRNLDPIKFSEKINLLNNYSAVFGLDLIYGLPGDTIEGFLSSLDYALMQIPNHLDIFRLSVFPGTELFERKDYFKLKCEQTVPYSVIETPLYSKEDLKKSEAVAESVDIFYNKGRSAGWLLSIVDVLNIKPSEFFLLFSSYLQKNRNYKSIYILQISFLKHIFKQTNNEKYLPVTLDLCKFHYLYSKVLYSLPGQFKEQSYPTYHPDTVFQKMPSLESDIFNFDPSLYSEYGMINIKKFMNRSVRNKSYALIINNGSGVETIPVEKWLYEITSEIKGKQTFSEILHRHRVNPKDAEEYISFLIETNLIKPIKGTY